MEENLTADEKRRRALIEEVHARLGHSIGGWVKYPNQFRPSVDTHVGTCQNAGCKCKGIIQLTPCGWALGGGYLASQKCTVTK